MGTHGPWLSPTDLEQSVRQYYYFSVGYCDQLVVKVTNTSLQMSLRRYVRGCMWYDNAEP